MIEIVNPGHDPDDWLGRRCDATCERGRCVRRDEHPRATEYVRWNDDGDSVLTVIDHLTLTGGRWFTW